jgi:hypothetical protein
LFQRLAACVTVGALGPNAQHFLHATNFGTRSLLIQTSEPPQNGQGCSGCKETGNPCSGSIAALRVSFLGMQFLACSSQGKGTARLPWRLAPRHVDYGGRAEISRAADRSKAAGG